MQHLNNDGFAISGLRRITTAAVRLLLDSVLLSFFLSLLPSVTRRLFVVFAPYHTGSSSLSKSSSSLTHDFVSSTCRSRIGSHLRSRLVPPSSTPTICHLIWHLLSSMHRLVLLGSLSTSRLSSLAEITNSHLLFHLKVY